MAESKQSSVAREFVGTLDAIINVCVRRNLGGMDAIRMFNVRSRMFERLPKKVRDAIPAPWYLMNEERMDLPVEEVDGKFIVQGLSIGGPDLGVKFWNVGDRLYGAGTPVPGEPYSIPTVNERDQLCTMQLVDIEMDGPRHYWATVAEITPVSNQEGRADRA